MADVIHPFRYWRALTWKERVALAIAVLSFLAMVLVSQAAKAEPEAAGQAVAASPLTPVLFAIGSIAAGWFAAMRASRGTGEAMAKHAKNDESAWVAAIDRMTEAMEALGDRFARAQQAAEYRMNASDERMNRMEDRIRGRVDRLEEAVDRHAREDDERFDAAEKRLDLLESKPR